MARFVRFSALGLAIAYTVLSIGVLGILAVPLWYAWRQNIEDVRNELIQEDVETMSDILQKQSIEALTSVIDARVQHLRVANLVIALFDAEATRVAGNLSALPGAAFQRSGVFRSTVDIDGQPAEAMLIRASLP